MLAAETGCGKTLAYLTPIIQQVLSYKEKVKFDNKFNSPLALIIVPGRELADQIGVCSVNINIRSERFQLFCDNEVIFYSELFSIGICQLVY